MKIINYINLTNGIEYLPELKNYNFIKIQSSICEMKKWNYLLQDLDNNFLMNLALGNKCIIYDCSNKKQIPRSFYQGLEFIKYVLNLIWFNKNYIPIVNTINCSKYFYNEYKKLDKRIKKKIKYYKKFLMTDKLNINIISKKTNLDGKYNIYKKILEDNL